MNLRIISRLILCGSYLFIINYGGCGAGNIGLLMLMRLGSWGSFGFIDIFAFTGVASVVFSLFFREVIWGEVLTLLGVVCQAIFFYWLAVVQASDRSGVIMPTAYPWLLTALYVLLTTSYTLLCGTLWKMDQGER